MEQPSASRGATRAPAQLRAAAVPAAQPEPVSTLVLDAVDRLPESLVLWRVTRDDQGTPAFRVTYANAEACAALGRSREAIIGSSLRGFYPWQLRDAVYEVLCSVAQTGEPTERKLRRLEYDHAREMLVDAVEVRASPSGDDIAVMWRDITDREQVEFEHGRLAAIIESTDDAIVGKTSGGEITSWNAGAELMYGYTAAEVVGQPILIIVPPERADEVADALLQVHDGKRVQRLETQRIRKDGTLIDVSLTVSPVLDADGNLIGVSTIARDVGDRKRAEAALRESEARFRAAFEGTPIGMALLSGRPDGDALVVEANQSWCELLDHDPGAEPGRHIGSWLHPDGRDFTLTQLSSLHLADVQQVQFETRLVARGETIWVNIACSKMRLPNESNTDGADDANPLWVMHVQDITAHKRAESQLTDRTLHDALTGLPNRVLLLDRLEAALARGYRRAQALALLFIDIDNFKVVNDSLGHDAGDHLLVEIAKRLRETVRDTDTAARLGGDEYMVLCEDTDHDAALEITARIGAAIREPFVVDGHNLHVTTSIGIAMLPHGGGPETRPVLADQLMRDADLAMYQAKRSGKNRYETFDRALRTKAVARLEIECELRAAIEDGDLRVHYQPIVSLESGRIDGFEALVRWQHPNHGLLAPSEFLEIAEETGLIVPLGEFVLEQACSQLTTWQQRYGPDLSMAINVSVRQLYGAEFPVVLARTLDATKVVAKSVHLEITETVLMDVTASTMHQIEALERLGVELVIDDFGTGYSSLLYLKRLPVRGLKIDRSFVNGVMDNPEDRAIVEAIVQLGGALDLHVVGEGVETIEQLSTLHSLGCRQVQGFLLAEPAPADQIDALLAAGTSRREVSA